MTNVTVKNGSTVLVNFAAAAQLGKKSRKQQGGFTLIEFLFVLGLILFASFLAYRQFGGMAIKTRVTTIADDVKTFVISQQSIVQGSNSATPYQSLTQASFAMAMKDSKLQVGDGTDPTSVNVNHRLGGATGLVTVVSVGATFGLDFVKASQAACPDFVSALEGAAITVTVNGTGVKSVDANGNVLVPYDAPKVQGLCQTGFVNEFVFTFR